MHSDLIPFANNTASSGAAGVVASNVDYPEFDPEPLLQGYGEGKLPLFVLGSGISAELVPLLGKMADALLEMVAKEAHLSKELKGQLQTKGKLATRADAAECFSLLQEPQTSDEGPKSLTGC